MADDTGFWDGVVGAAALPWGRAGSPAVNWLAQRLPPDARVLVPGCGYGRNALALAQRGLRVEAYDYSDVAIARARAEFADPRIVYSVRDVLDLPAGPFEGVFCHFLLHLFRTPERRRIVAALAYVLAP